MSRPVLAVLAAVLLIASVVGWWWWQNRDEAPAPEAAVEPMGPESEAEPLSVELFFPDTAGRLHPERHDIAGGGSVEDQIRALVEALLAGPRATGLRAPLPTAVSVGHVYLIDGIVYLDLESEEGAVPPASGSRREMLTVYSVVNSVLLNFADAESLVLLWNGHQPRTFAGHLDTARPLLPATGLIARPAAAAAGE